MSQKKIIGRREVVDILDLELYGLDAKIDTGADSNSLHCDDIFIDDEKFVHFTLLDEVHPAYHGKKHKLSHQPTIYQHFHFLLLFLFADTLHLAIFEYLHLSSHMPFLLAFLK
ncbi:MAG: hypothetical protein R2837_02865 [Aliarcobacter sp.]